MRRFRVGLILLLAIHPVALYAWDEGEIAISAGPSIGRALSDSADQSLVDDSEYELSGRYWWSIDRLNGLRFQLKGGVTSSPNFDDDEGESAIYGELQIGDTYIPVREFLRGEFPDAEATQNAIRPYARYRFSTAFDGLLDSRLRDSHQGTAGVRYRRIETVLRRDPSTSGIYWESRAELNRSWSTDDAYDLWNPRVQTDFYGRPFWGGTRFVLRGTAEAMFFTSQRTADGARRRDWRLRITSGLDVSRPVQRWLGWNSISVELLGRLQQRWSNDRSVEHTRVYFVPSLSISVPLR